MLAFLFTIGVLLSLRRYLGQNCHVAAIPLMKLAWYAGIACYEYHIIQQLPLHYQPHFLNGPSIHHDYWIPSPQPLLTLLYEISLGYHGHSWISGLIEGAKLEMHVHHVVTLLLIGLSDLYGFRHIGAIVMLLHDAPDIIISIVKASLRLKSTWLTVTSHIVNLVTWAFFRIYCLGKFLHALYLAEILYSVEVYYRYGFGFLIGCLITLHFVWYCMFWKLMLHYVWGGQVKDTTEKVVHGYQINGNKHASNGNCKHASNGVNKHAGNGDNRSTKTVTYDNAMNGHEHSNGLRLHASDGILNGHCHEQNAVYMAKTKAD
eukprot:TRINITY_DN8527_c0_g1_i5.p1 TRINITY_DN8527_c0_g1~~TRINITY_DN8527_c0_g1_i5.p1  ORF type:complete len:318 (+),score=56.23 TRINITY_DN8527_c0_g1_i5:84-1037(+)